MRPAASFRRKTIVVRDGGRKRLVCEGELSSLISGMKNTSLSAQKRRVSRRPNLFVNVVDFDVESVSSSSSSGSSRSGKIRYGQGPICLGIARAADSQEGNLNARFARGLPGTEEKPKPPLGRPGRRPQHHAGRDFIPTSCFRFDNIQLRAENDECEMDSEESTLFLDHKIFDSPVQSMRAQVC